MVSAARMVRTKHLLAEVFQSGPRDGPVILLVHGWPDDATTWSKVARQLNEAGFRTIAPMHRGFGATRFHSKNALRTGNVGVLALDAIDLMDALDVDQFYVAGHDWGSNIAETLALVWPRRVPAIAMLSTPSRLGGLQTPPFDIARRYWYHWFQCTRRGADAVANDPTGFARIMWETWSPQGWFDEKVFRRVAASFGGKDWAEITLHSYRSRWGEAAFDPRSLKIEAKIKSTKRLKTPTLFIHGAKDGVTPPQTTVDMAKKFTGPFNRVVLRGVGHFLTREAPDRVGALLVKHFSAFAQPAPRR